MYRYVEKIVLLSSLSVCLAACDSAVLESKETVPKLCTAPWFEYVEAKVAVTDEHGHGPDIGGEEWRWVVERKLGIDESEDSSASLSEAWCEYIQTLINK